MNMLPAPYEPTRPTPLVGIVTGSVSDQPKLEKCDETLDKLGVPYGKGIKSAHCTRDEMARYAKDAGLRGVKILTGATGGVAQLAGHALIRRR